VSGPYHPAAHVPGGLDHELLEQVLGNLGHLRAVGRDLDAARRHLAESLDLARVADGQPREAAASGAAITVLTPRELDVLKLVAQGLSNPDIARRLVLSEHTVHRHLGNILRKLDLSSRAAAAAWGVRAGLV
jgi:DNA-binding NarL/FixJ family response regulator